MKTGDIIKYDQDYEKDILDIWLYTNIKAHSFIPEKYWNDNLELIKDKYIPESETYVYVLNNKAVGFISIVDRSFIGALFVKEEFQANGIGTALIDFCIQRYETLALNAFRDNRKTVEFYKRYGFKIVDEHTDDNTGFLEYTMKI